MIDTAGTLGEKFAAVVVATIGASVAPQLPGADAAVPFVWGVLKLYVVAIGFFGSLVSLTFLRPRDLWVAWSCVLSGTGIAAVMTPFVTKLWVRYAGDAGMGPEAETALAFVFGVAGFALVPILLSLLERFKANPWGMIDWIRGRGTPPPGGTP